MKQVGRYPDLFFGVYFRLYKLGQRSAVSNQNEIRPRLGFKKLLNKTHNFSDKTSFPCVKGSVWILSGLRAFVNLILK